MDETITIEEFYNEFTKFKRDIEAKIAIIEQRLGRLENAENSNSTGQ